EEIDANIALHEAAIALGNAPEHFPKHVQMQRSNRRARLAELRAIGVELHMRPALSLGCLCFVLIGCPVGIWFSRSDYLSAFITCFLPIVVIYYPLLLCGINFAKLGRLNPWLALWTANALMAVIALGLF